jgi:hypothetical protein
MNKPMILKWNGRIFQSKNKMAAELAEERGVTAKCLVKTITGVINRDGTLYGYDIEIIQPTKGK